MPQLKNDRLLKALRREPVHMTPVRIMRQAGRYLPEYRAVLKKAGSLMTLCQTPELACEVTLAAVTTYALEGRIIFSEILTIPDAMGFKASQFVEGEGPLDQVALFNLKQISNSFSLSQNPEKFKQYVYDANPV